MKIKISKKIEKEISLRSFGGILSSMWGKYYKVFFVVFFLGSMTWVSFIWYESFYTEAWTKQEKENYIIINSERINFDREKYDKASELIHERNTQFNLSPGTQYRDIFH